MTVTFSQNSELFIVDSFLCEEIDLVELWYTREELESLRTKFVKHVHRLRSKGWGNIHGADDDAIGLERFVSLEVTNEYQSRKKKLIRDILDDNAFHHEPHQSDEMNKNHRHVADRLARISATNSMWARERARLSAMILEDQLVSEFLLHYMSIFSTRAD